MNKYTFTVVNDKTHIQVVHGENLLMSEVEPVYIVTNSVIEDGTIDTDSDVAYFPIHNVYVTIKHDIEFKDKDGLIIYKTRN